MAMTRETHIRIGLDDIDAIYITCKKCEREIGQGLDANFRPFPNRCPWCQEFWGNNEVDLTALKCFTDVLRRFPELHKEKVVVTLRIPNQETIREDASSQGREEKH